MCFLSVCKGKFYFLILSFFFKKPWCLRTFCWDSRLIIAKEAWITPFFIVNSNIPCKELLFTHASNLAQKPLYLVGTILKISLDVVLIGCKQVTSAPLEWSGSGAMIQAHLDHAVLKKMMYPFLEWISSGCFYANIRVILNHRSWFGSSQRNAPRMSHCYFINACQN